MPKKRHNAIKVCVNSNNNKIKIIKIKQEIIYKYDYKYNRMKYAILKINFFISKYFTEQDIEIIKIEEDLENATEEIYNDKLLNDESRYYYVQDTTSNHEYLKSIFFEIDHVLWKYWDPIGVNYTDSTRDEYTSYVWMVLSKIESGINSEKLADFLDDIVKTYIGLSSNKNHSLIIAEILLIVFEYSKARNFD